ncbi:MAG: STAS domain-containing protein [Candidatus Omnitrophica bacterium]|nr:STAS domain-containing protein [Candidatus Omnitrophota bacterium]
MELQIEARPLTGGIHEVRLEGSLDSATHQHLEGRLQRLMEQPVAGLIFDMSGVHYVSSAGVRVIFWAQKHLRDRQAHVALTGLRPKVNEIFEIMKIVPVLNIFDEIQDAQRFMDRVMGR